MTRSQNFQSMCKVFKKYTPINCRSNVMVIAVYEGVSHLGQTKSNQILGCLADQNCIAFSDSVCRNTPLFLSYLEVVGLWTCAQNEYMDFTSTPLACRNCTVCSGTISHSNNSPFLLNCVTKMFKT